MKLLVLLTVVFCTFALAFGMVGCAADGKDGANGKDGKDGISIESVYINEDGELVIKLTDGTEKNAGVVKGDKGDQGGTFDSECDHAYVMHEVRAASCTQEQILLNICTKCDGYEVVVGQKDSNNHVKYEWKKSDAGFYAEVETEDITIHEQTELEEAMGACPEKTCNLCKTDLEAHENIIEKPVSSDAVICEEEHLVAEFCLDCKAYVSAITKRAPIGHKYKDVNNGVYADTTANTFNVSLVCEECGDTTTAVATKDATKSVVATCKTGGYDIYTYSYEYSNGTAPETKTADIKINVVDKAAEHTFTSGEYTLRAELNGSIEFNLTNGPALKAMLADNTIRTIAGVPTVCTAYTQAVADCAVCEHPIIINVSGEHALDATKEVKATCTDDAYIACAATGCTYKEYTTKAVGHEYAYVDGSFVATDVTDLTKGGTISVKCNKCTLGGLTNVAVKHVEHHDGVDCKDVTYDKYETTALTNGLVSTHTNYVANVKLQVVINDADAVLHHVLGKGTAYEINGLANNQNYDYNSKVAAAIAAGAIRTIAGANTSCDTYTQATYDCGVCGHPFILNISGEHNVSGDLLTKDATCTNFGYTYRVCQNANCKADGDKDGIVDKHVVEEYIEPVEHNFSVVPASEEAFLNALASATVGTTKVQFACACGATVDFTLKKIETVIEGDSACNPIDKTPYVFEYSYTKTMSTKVVETVTVTKTIYSADGEESHKLVVGDKSYDDIAVNEEIAKTDVNIQIWRDGVEAGIVRWIAGVPGTCQQKSTVVFDCADCGEPILAVLYGECQLDAATEKVTEPTCTVGGKTEQQCTVCKEWIVVATTDALGHDYAWKLDTATVVSYDSANRDFSFAYGTVTGTCKNDETHVVTATADAIDADDITANCCEGQTIQVSYRYDGKVVYTESVKIDATGDHIIQDNTLQPPVKGAVYVDFDAKVVYVFQWCFEGERYVLVGKIDIADGACADAENHELIEVYNNGEIKVVVCDDEGKAFIVEIKK